MITIEPKDSDFGNYTIDIALVDENPNPMPTFYSINISVTSPRG